jgi:hypothetical protein
MATNAEYSRGIVMTASGQALDRPTKISGVTIVAVTADTYIKLRDGTSIGAVIWEGEGDNATSSLTKTFDPPLRFYNKLYVQFVSSGANSSVSLEVIEP